MVPLKHTHLFRMGPMEQLISQMAGLHTYTP